LSELRDKGFSFKVTAVALSLLVSCSVLNLAGLAVAWSNGGYSSDPNNPAYGTHDWIAEHAMNLLLSNESNWLAQNKNAFLYGTEAPDNSHASFKGHNGYGDTSKHHNYYSGTSCTDDSASTRARQEYQSALDSLRSGDYAVAAWYAGAMAHYIADVAVFGHVMTDEIHHSDYEDRVNEVSDSYDQGTFLISFDGSIETTSAYDAATSLGLNTYSDDGGTYTAAWMDANFQGTSVSAWTAEYRGRTGESLNLAVNLIADVLHTLIVESGQPAIPWFPIIAICLVSIVVVAAGARQVGMRNRCKKCGEESHMVEETHSTKNDLYKLAHDQDLVNRTHYSGEDLADFAASSLGRRIILVVRRTHRAAWLFFPSLTMVHDAQPRPAKLVLPNGAVIWRTNSRNNKPEDAREYKVRKLGTTMKGGFRCSCGTQIESEKIVKRLTCPGCGKQYEFTMEEKETVWLWGAPFEAGFKLREIKSRTKTSARVN